MQDSEYERIAAGRSRSLQLASRTSRILYPVCLRSALFLLLFAATAQPGLAEPPVTALAFAPDGEAVVAGSSDGIVVRATDDLDDVELIATSLEQVHALSFSPNGEQLIAVGGVPGESGAADVYLWPDRELAGHWEAGADVLYTVDWLPDGDAVALAGFDGTTRIVAARTGKTQREWSGHSRAVTDVCVFPSGDVSASAPIVVTGSIDQTLRVVDLSTGEVLRTLHNHTHPVHAMALKPSADGELPVMASVSDDRTVRLWQPTIGRMMRFVRLDSVPLCVAWTPDGTRLVAGCADGHVRTVDPDAAAVAGDLPTFSDRVTSLAMHPTRSVVAIGSHAGEFRVVLLDAETE